MGGFVPSVPGPTADPAGDAAAAEFDESLALPAVPLADSEATSAAAAFGNAAAEAEATEAPPAARSRSAQPAAPDASPSARPAQSAAPPPAGQSSPAAGRGSPSTTPSLPLSIPWLPLPPAPGPTPGQTTASDAATSSAPFTDGIAPPTTSPIVNQLQQILDTLIVLQSMLGSGGMRMPGFTALESALQPSMGTGAAAAAEYDLAVFQQNEGDAFNALDNGLLDTLYALAGSNTVYQDEMRTIVANTDAQLAMLGPYAYTSAGHQEAAAILDNALASALQVCQSSHAQSVVASASIDNLTRQYLVTMATPGSGTSGSAAGSGAASIAENYLGWYESQLQANGVDGSAPYGESCANFVSSMLEKAGLINWHTNLVAGLATQLPAQGWTQVSLANAKPGDVWICDGADGESHTEIVASNNGGHVTLIGSNNVSSDMQQISYDSYSASIPGSYILAPP
jgi:hypothetical protein